MKSERLKDILGNENVWIIPDWNNKQEKEMEERKEVGVPWILIAQIVLAIISYLLRRTPSLADRRHLTGLRDTLQAGFPDVQEWKED